MLGLGVGYGLLKTVPHSSTVSLAAGTMVHVMTMTLQEDALSTNVSVDRKLNCMQKLLAEGMPAQFFFSFASEAPL